MASGQFFRGVSLLLLTVTPLALAATSIRARFLPSWNGVSARVAEAIAALGGLTVIAEALGVVGALKRWPLVAGCAASGVGAFLLTRSARPPGPLEAPTPGSDVPRSHPARLEAVV